MAATTLTVPATGVITGRIGNHCGYNDTHAGIDIARGAGGPIYAAAGGTVSSVVISGGSTGYGTYVIVNHGSGYTTLYAHLVQTSVLVSMGSSVSQGQQLASMGTTGNSTGVHLHFELRLNNASQSSLNGYFTCGRNVVAGASTGITIDGGTPIGGSPLSHITGNTGGWTSGSTGLSIAGQASGVYMGGTWPQVMSSEQGILYQTWGDTAGWHKASTGIPLSGSVSAVNMGGTWPQVMSIENSTLYQVWGDSTGWHKATTGLMLTGQISAVNMGGTWPVIMLTQGGVLYRVWGDTAGWHVQSTGIAASGPISALNMGRAHPDVMLSEGGLLYQIYFSDGNWHKASTLVPVSGVISAVNMGRQWPDVMVSEATGLYQIVGTTAGWSKMPTGLPGGGSSISALNLGGTWPEIMKVG